MVQEQYGYLLLNKESADETFAVVAVCNKLFANMWECMNEATLSLNQRPASTKIGYFQIMSNGAIVKNLHATCRLQQTVQKQ